MTICIVLEVIPVDCVQVALAAAAAPRIQVIQHFFILTIQVTKKICIGGNCFFAIVAVDIGGCTGVKIYSRDSWGARRPKSFSTFHTPASLFFVHHTAGNECHDFNSCASTLRGIQNYHMDTRGNKNEWNVKERGRNEMKRN